MFHFHVNFFHFSAKYVIVKIPQFPHCVPIIVKLLLSRNFCQKCMRENSRNFNTVYTLWKNEKFSLTKFFFFFRLINSLVTYLVNLLLSRNFWQKCMRENSRNFQKFCRSFWYSIWQKISSKWDCKQDSLAIKTKIQSLPEGVFLSEQILVKNVKIMTFLKQRSQIE